LLQYRDNAVFRVVDQSGQQFVLRLTADEHYPVTALQGELAWLAALHAETPLLVPEPIPNALGELLTTVRTPHIPVVRHCCLFRWLPGRFLRTRFSARTLAQVGQFTAQLHNHGASWPNAGQAARPLWTWERFFGPRSVYNAPGEGLGLTATDREGLAAIAEVVRSAMSQLGRGPANFGMIHADLHQANYFLHRGQVGAIDFEDCGPGYFVFDMATTLLEISHPLDEPDHYARMREAYLNGYSKVRAVPMDIDRQLLVFTALRLVFLLNWVAGSTNPEVQQEGQSWVPWAVKELKLYLDALPA
jgi:Ser/Thr protein kinase RdoA (MazF antagonist)